MEHLNQLLKNSKKKNYLWATMVPPKFSLRGQEWCLIQANVVPKELSGEIDLWAWDPTWADVSAVPGGAGSAHRALLREFKVRGEAHVRSLCAGFGDALHLLCSRGVGMCLLPLCSYRPAL